MQGPWSIFLIQSESEKEINVLLLCIIIYMYWTLNEEGLSKFDHNGLSVFLHFLQKNGSIVNVDVI